MLRLDGTGESRNPAGGVLSSVGLREEPGEAQHLLTGALGRTFLFPLALLPPHHILSKAEAQKRWSSISVVKAGLLASGPSLIPCLALSHWVAANLLTERSHRCLRSVLSFIIAARTDSVPYFTQDGSSGRLGEC